MEYDIKQILSQFNIDVDAQLYGEGHINTTYLAEIAPDKYILQKINTNIFTDPDGLMKNIAEKKLFLLSNARYIGKIGWCILIGNTAVLLIRRFFNYYLIKVFLPPEAAELISFRAGPDLMGLVMGVLVLLLSAVYGYACRMHAGGFDAVDAQPPAKI